MINKKGALLGRCSKGQSNNLGYGAAFGLHRFPVSGHSWWVLANFFHCSKDFFFIRDSDNPCCTEMDFNRNVLFAVSTFFAVKYLYFLNQGIHNGGCQCCKLGTLPDCSEDYEEQQWQQEEYSRVRAAFSKLSPKERFLIEKRNGISGAAWTFEQLATAYEYSSTQSVERAYKKALRKLEHELTASEGW